MYLYVFWGSAILMFALAFALRGGGGLVGWIAGACAFKAIREGLTLRGTYELDRASKGMA
jgi:hypothetical protein